METSISGANQPFCMHKASGEVRDPQRLLILVIMALLRVHKTTDEG